MSWVGERVVYRDNDGVERRGTITALGTNYADADIAFDDGSPCVRKAIQHECEEHWEIGGHYRRDKSVPLRVEIGGGTRNRGDGWLNVDLCPTADVRHDLNETPWPFADESVDELYSSHCIEHVQCPISFLREVARICKVGATVEIRCPDSMGEMAMCAGHVSVVSIDQMRHASDVFPEIFFGGRPRRLRIESIEPGCDDYWFPLARANPLFKDWFDIDILTWIPRTRHENRFHLRVEPCHL